jgi:hypothetical protein
MPLSTLIRMQQPSLFNQKNYSNNGEKHTTIMLRLIDIFDYIYVFIKRILIYFFLLIKRLSRFLYDFWTFSFVSVRGSRKKVIKICKFLE